ncbi:MAG: PQQ-binding-like beta-propeller repeat protein [Planctomycetaceae bacterium]
MFQIRRWYSVCVSVFVLTSSLHYSACSVAGDWPQILGPQRNGVAASDESLLKEWKAGGPDVLWESSVGAGFAGVAVAGNRVIVFDREATRERVLCLETATGNVLWESGTKTSYQGGVSEDKGPRCVPVISGNVVVTLGVEGLLRCLKLEDGSEVWKRDTTADYRPLEGYFGVGSTPVVYRNLVIVNVGGREASVVAFDLSTGETAWKAFTDAASYSSPIVARFGEKDLAVVVTRLHVVGLDPSTGTQVFSIPFGARGPTVNGATPVVTQNRIFLSSSYNIGSLLIECDGDTAKESWRDEELLATQYATPVSSSNGDNIVFAVDGRQDAGRGTCSLKCLDIAAHKVLWEESGFDYGTLLRVNKDVLFLTCTGELIRFEDSTTSFRERSRSTVLQPTDRGYRLPALSGGRLFIRDDETLKVLTVGPAK